MNPLFDFNAYAISQMSTKQRAVATLAALFAHFSGKMTTEESHKVAVMTFDILAEAIAEEAASKATQTT